MKLGVVPMVVMTTTFLPAAVAAGLHGDRDVLREQQRDGHVPRHDLHRGRPPAVLLQALGGAAQAGLAPAPVLGRR